MVGNSIPVLRHYGRSRGSGLGRNTDISCCCTQPTSNDAGKMLILDRLLDS